MGLLSNYCGFGGSGIPQHKVDEICAEHDKDYNLIQQSGKNPYLHYNWADKKMLQALQTHSAAGFKEKILKLGATAMWKMKEQVTSSLSDLPQSTEMSSKRLRRHTDDEDFIERNVRPRMRTVSINSDATASTIGDNDADMIEEKHEDGGNTGSPEAMRASNSTGQHGYKETRIIPQQPHYGIPEVMTLTVPHTFYFAVAPNFSVPNQNGAVDFVIRTTSMGDFFPNTLTDAVAGAAVGAGLYDRVAPGGTAWPNPTIHFPSETVNKTNERGQWQLYYMRLYQAYTVLKCDWDITFHNPRNAVNADVIIGMVEEAYGTSSGNVAPDSQPMIQVENWPGVRYCVVHSTGDSTERDNWKKMAGTYYPGKANKNVRNDESVQTWTTYTDPLNPPNPSLTEQLHFMVWRGPFADVQGGYALNVRVHLRITVQLRDLIAAARYPSNQGAVTQTLPADAFSVS